MLALLLKGLIIGFAIATPVSLMILDGGMQYKYPDSNAFSINCERLIVSEWLPII